MASLMTLTSRVYEPHSVALGQADLSVNPASACPHGQRPHPLYSCPNPGVQLIKRQNKSPPGALRSSDRGWTGHLKTPLFSWLQFLHLYKGEKWPRRLLFSPGGLGRTRTFWTRVPIFSCGTKIKQTLKKMRKFTLNSFIL